MNYELVCNKKIILCTTRDSLQEAVEFFNNQIYGDGVWKKHLTEYDPKNMKIRTYKIVYDCYDLNGMPIDDT